MRNSGVRRWANAGLLLLLLIATIQGVIHLIAL